ncbi:hypothetical protein FGO68_gene13004 [Halteria grandinella]|uniref:EF-hand domain-containing protein n=1 Tax=Halteria grandinella TaxID=5974 RepID=A0A8J8NAD0_HALGN|nr:hypothetical protein FGO68_gene13004 [Halteria grandinella]
MSPLYHRLLSVALQLSKIRSQNCKSNQYAQANRVSKFLRYRSRITDFQRQLQALKKYIQVIQMSKTKEGFHLLRKSMRVDKFIQLLKLVWRDHKNLNISLTQQLWPQLLTQQFLETMKETPLLGNTTALIDLERVNRFIDLFSEGHSLQYARNSNFFSDKSIPIKIQEGQRGDGVRQVIRQIVEKMKDKGLNNQNAQDVMDAFDARRLGQLSIKDFIQGCEGLGLTINDNDLQKVFMYIDSETRDGVLDLNDLQQGFFQQEKDPEENLRGNTSSFRVRNTHNRSSAYFRTLDKQNGDYACDETSIFLKKKDAFDPSMFVRSESMPKLLPTTASQEPKFKQPSYFNEPKIVNTSMMSGKKLSGNNIEALMNRIKEKQKLQVKDNESAYKTSSYFNVRKSEQSPFLHANHQDEVRLASSRKKKPLESMSKTFFHEPSQIPQTHFFKMNNQSHHATAASTTSSAVLPEVEMNTNAGSRNTTGVYRLTSQQRLMRKSCESGVRKEL